MKWLAALPVLLLIAVLALACKEEEAPTGTPSPAATATAPATTGAEATATPEATPEEREPRVIFLRPQPGPSDELLAVIHMSDLAGSSVIQLTPADVRAFFVALAEHGGTTTLYYFAGDQSGGGFTLEARDLATGETVALASVEAGGGSPPEGSLSPDGRHIAISHYEGIDLFDLTTNTGQRILDSNRAACEAAQVGECYSYYAPDWSPDGRLLLLEKGFWETGTAVVVDPFEEAPQEFMESFIGDPFPSFAAWSPASNALCAYGKYDAPSGLYLSEEPEWQFRNLLPEYETYPPATSEYRSVTDCVWLDEGRIAFAVYLGHENGSTVSVYDLETAAVSDLADIGASSPQLFLVPGTNTLVLTDWEGGQPGLLDTTDGTRTSILQPGDRVVAVTRPVGLPQEIVSATPEVEPCVPLTAQCEAQVTNVAPERLNVREQPNLTADVIGELSEGETVCLSGSSLFGLDFRWWPVRLHSGLEGWVAHGNPEKPERPWLSATGRRCEE